MMKKLLLLALILGSQKSQACKPGFVGGRKRAKNSQQNQQGLSKDQKDQGQRALPGRSWW